MLSHIEEIEFGDADVGGNKTYKIIDIFISYVKRKLPWLEICCLALVWQMLVWGVIL